MSHRVYDVGLPGSNTRETIDGPVDVTQRSARSKSVSSKRWRRKNRRRVITMRRRIDKYVNSSERSRRRGANATNLVSCSFGVDYNNETEERQKCRFLRENPHYIGIEVHVRVRRRRNEKRSTRRMERMALACAFRFEAKAFGDMILRRRGRLREKKVTRRIRWRSKGGERGF